MRIVFTGSGSGGHFYPLIAIAEAITDRVHSQHLIAPELYHMGPTPYDSGSLFSHGITHLYVPAGKVRRYFSIRNITDAFKTFLGIIIAFTKLLMLYPDVVMSKGSYTSMPVVIAAWLLRIPVVVHESDVRPGRANALAARFAHTVAISYDSAATHFASKRIVKTGIPIRKHLLEQRGGDIANILQLKEPTPLIVVLGGSQGAERVNDLITMSLDELLPNYAVLHQTGEGQAQLITETAHALVKRQEFLDKYIVRGFLDVDTLGAALRGAALVISRAGSGSIYEIACHGKPSILIPIPEEISHDQRANAYEYARTGAASVMEEENLTPHLLVAEITRIMSDQALQLSMQQAALAFAPRDAAYKIADILISIGQRHA